MSGYPNVLGIYSQKLDTVIGTGGTQKDRETVTYWYVRQLSEDAFEIQPLNAHHVPSGVCSKLPAMDFLRQYTPEPGYYNTNTVPALKTLARKLRMGEEALAAGDLDEAEQQFIKALMIDELSVDANFGLGEVYIKKEDVAKLREVLDRLLCMDQAFHEEHRVKFNSFGINLRKHGHYDDSIRYYEKSLEIIDTDENVHFNMARVYFEKNSLDKAVEYLKQALKIRPGFTEAQKFLQHCLKAQAV